MAEILWIADEITINLKMFMYNNKTENSDKLKTNLGVKIYWKK